MAGVLCQLPRCFIDAVCAQMSRCGDIEDLYGVFSCLIDRLTHFKGKYEKKFCESEIERVVLRVIVESARRGLSTEDLQDVLPDSRLTSAILKVYEEKKDVLEEMLSSIGWEPPRIVDFDWTLCNGLESNVGKEFKPVAELHFDALPCGSTEAQKISVSCDRDQLQFICWTLKEAQNSIASLKDK